MSACTETDMARLTEVPFTELGVSDTQAQAGLAAFRKSCSAVREPLYVYDRIINIDNYKALCAHAQQTQPSQAYNFFTRHFTAFMVEPPRNAAPLLTGYYAPTLRGSLVRSDEFKVPLYAPPLDDVRTSLTRADINAGALEGRGLEVLYLADAVDAFFLHIQGSGSVTLPDGTIRAVRFAAKNDMPYTPIGAKFVADGSVAREDMSADWLKAWLRAHSDEAQKVMQRNTSYVYFTLGEEGDAEVIGAQGTPLTPMQSIAIDPTYLSYGLPIWVQTPDADITQLAITQDTGSAITGPVRADLFAGSGEEAEALAGRLQSPVDFTILVPRSGN